MLRAERAYRNELRAVTIAQISQAVVDDDDGSIVKRSCQFFEAHMRPRKSISKGT